jgi:hypothetical protein
VPGEAPAKSFRSDATPRSLQVSTQESVCHLTDVVCLCSTQKMLPTVTQSLPCCPVLTVLNAGLTETMWATSGSHRTLHHCRPLHCQDKDSPFSVQPPLRAQNCDARTHPRLDHSLRGKVPNEYITVDWLLFLQEQIKVIISGPHQRWQPLGDGRWGRVVGREGAKR